MHKIWVLELPRILPRSMPLADGTPSAAITPSSHQFLCHLFSSASFAASAIFSCSVLPESMQDLQ
jgi:hypothetical protein